MSQGVAGCCGGVEPDWAQLHCSDDKGDASIGSDADAMPELVPIPMPSGLILITLTKLNDHLSIKTTTEKLIVIMTIITNNGNNTTERKKRDNTHLRLHQNLDDPRTLS